MGGQKKSVLQASNDGTNWVTLGDSFKPGAHRYYRSVDAVPVTETWHLGPDGNPDFHEVRTMSDEKPSPDNGHRACQSHCCVWHGCKYGYEDCPVVTRLLVQEHPCEDCGQEDPRLEALRDDAPAMLELLRDWLEDHEAGGRLDNARACARMTKRLLDKHGRAP